MLSIGCVHRLLHAFTKPVWQEVSCPPLPASFPTPGQDHEKQQQTDPPAKAGSSKTGRTAAPLGMHHCFYHSTTLGVDPTGCCHSPAILLHSFWFSLVRMGLAGLGSAGLPLDGLGASPVSLPAASLLVLPFSTHQFCALPLSFQHHVPYLSLRENGRGWMAGAEDTGCSADADNLPMGKSKASRNFWGFLPKTSDDIGGIE